LLAEGLKAAGEGNKLKTSVLLSPMDEPRGHCAVGNALEVREACRKHCRVEARRIFVAITLDLAAAVSDSPEEKSLAGRLEDVSFSAWRKFLSLVEAQGGNSRRHLKTGTPFYPAPVVRPLPSPHDGTIAGKGCRIDRFRCRPVGAGRHKTTASPINPCVGFSRIRKTGEKISRGEPLLWIHAASED